MLRTQGPYRRRRRWSCVGVCRPESGARRGPTGSLSDSLKGIPLLDHGLNDIYRFRTLLDYVRNFRHCHDSCYEGGVGGEDEELVELIIVDRVCWGGCWWESLVNNVAAQFEARCKCPVVAVALADCIEATQGIELRVRVQEPLPEGVFELCECICSDERLYKLVSDSIPPLCRAGFLEMDSCKLDFAFRKELSRMELVLDVKCIFAVVEKDGDCIWSKRAGEVWYRRKPHDYERTEWMRNLEVRGELLPLYTIMSYP